MQESIIPRRCQACPFIHSALMKYQEAEAILYILEHSEQMKEFADRDTVNRQIEELTPLVEQRGQELNRLLALTVGCVGVKLANVKIDDEFLTSAECQSPLKST